MNKYISMIKSGGYKLKTWVQQNPYLSFYGLMGLLLLLVVTGNVLRQPKSQPASEAETPKKVDAFKIGDSPMMTMTGKLEASGIITISAQTGGVVQAVNVTEGKTVQKGSPLVSLSATYSGANPSVVSRQIAEKNAENAKLAYESQKEIIGKQREAAEKSNIQAKDMIEISKQSLDDSRSLLSLNEEILRSLDNQITFLESINVKGASDSAILSAKQGKAALQGGMNQLKSAIRQLEYSTDPDNPQAHLADIQKDITLKQLVLQEKSAAITADIAALNVKLARINVSLSYPTSPAAGIVERVFVKKGQTVAPGTPLLTIKANQRDLSLAVPVSIDTARLVSRTQPSVIEAAGKKYFITPRYVSLLPNDGSNAGVIIYSLPASLASELEGKVYQAISVPVGLPAGSVSDPYIPIDAVYQTEDKAYVYTVKTENNQSRAVVKEVELGSVSGSYINVVSGITSQDIIVTTRGLTEGDLLELE